MQHSLGRSSLRHPTASRGSGLVGLMHPDRAVGVGDRLPPARTRQLLLPLLLLTALCGCTEEEPAQESKGAPPLPAHRLAHLGHARAGLHPADGRPRGLAPCRLLRRVLQADPRRPDPRELRGLPRRQRGRSPAAAGSPHPELRPLRRLSPGQAPEAGLRRSRGLSDLPQVRRGRSLPAGARGGRRRRRRRRSGEEQGVSPRSAAQVQHGAPDEPELVQYSSTIAGWGASTSQEGSRSQSAAKRSRASSLSAARRVSSRSTRCAVIARLPTATPFGLPPSWPRRPMVHLPPATINLSDCRKDALPFVGHLQDTAASRVSAGSSLARW